MVFSVAMVKDIIPYISFQDKNWKHFNKADFNSGEYDMHGTLYHVIRNKLESLQFDDKKSKEKNPAHPKPKTSETSPSANASNAGDIG